MIFYKVLYAILQSSITHVSHLMIIGERFRYEHILHNIEHNTAMVRFANVVTGRPA
jgi:hypothetical protein